MKYKYTGDDEKLLIEFHKNVKPGDVVDAGDREINSVFFVPVEDEKKPKATQATQTKEDAN